MAHLLGIDIGTSSAKAALVDSSTLQTIAVAGHEYPVYRPTPDRAEQDAEDWWRAVVSVVQQVLQQSGHTTVDAISFSGHMHGGVLLDEAFRPQHPAIIWADQRSAAQVSQIVECVGHDELLRITGTLPAAGFMNATLMWLKQHMPDVLARTEHFALPKDYVRLKMTGVLATDPSDAASTGLFNIAEGSWAHNLIQQLELPRGIFPPIRAAYEITGELTPEAASQLGLAAGIPIIAGCADQPAQALGNGILRDGTASVTVGSGGQVFMPLTSPVPGDARLHIFNHALPDTWYALGATLSAGLSLRWLRSVLGMADDPHAYSTFSAEAAAVAAGADGLVFLPYLAGERTPHMDALARGVFIGLTPYHTRGHLARAVMEGVAFSLKQALNIAIEVGGSANTLVASGGGMESDVWRQIMADIFGIPLRKSLQKEQAAIGAAILAGVGISAFSAQGDTTAKFAAAAEHAAVYGQPTLPRTKYQHYYDELFAQFSTLYPLLRDKLHWLSQHTTIKD